MKQYYTSETTSSRANLQSFASVVWHKMNFIVIHIDMKPHCCQNCWCLTPNLPTEFRHYSHYRRSIYSHYRRLNDLEIWSIGQVWRKHEQWWQQCSFKYMRNGTHFSYALMRLVWWSVEPISLGESSWSTYQSTIIYKHIRYMYVYT